ncbi:hypothetical protein [Arthrobacter sp. lap29]|uniref:hypothetical protein n=1 Tax=Arthrobacter sp. lap29 TaxID=3056122 RepID=UPI0028F6C0E7|nr:hypothetical protein [Arthrobacter sp. lap29]
MAQVIINGQWFAVYDGKISRHALAQELESTLAGGQTRVYKNATMGSEGNDVPGTLIISETQTAFVINNDRPA